MDARVTHPARAAHPARVMRPICAACGHVVYPVHVAHSTYESASFVAFGWSMVWR